MISLLRLSAFACLLAVVGCNTVEPQYDVKGKVTFQSEVVSEGEVQMIDERTGRGGQVELKPDGTYEIKLHAGQYKVVITPPYLVDNKSGIPNPYYKKVKNIPAKYHSTATSGYVVDVSAEKTTHDFELKP